MFASSEQVRKLCEGHESCSGVWDGSGCGGCGGGGGTLPAGEKITQEVKGQLKPPIM